MAMCRSIAFLPFFLYFFSKGVFYVDKWHNISNRRFILLEERKVQDITYLDCGVKSEPVLFGEACRQVCEKTFASLDKYFNVDYNVSLVFGTAKREYTGLAPEVKKSIMEKF